MMNKNEWKKVKLEDVFELQIGRTPSRNNKNYWDNGSNNWISISDIKENEKYIEKTKERITNLAIQDSKIKLVPKNTVIMSFKLSVGKTAITSQDIYTNEAIVAFIPKVLNLVDNNFLYYYLQNINWKDGINKAVKGLTLNKPLISNKIIFLPNLKIQKQIAKKLDTVFSILNLKKQQLLELDKLVKFQFLKLTGNLITNEKKWNFEILKNICDVRDGTHDSPKYVENGYPLITSKNITNGFLDFNNINYISKEDFDKINKRSKVDKGDIIMPMIGTIGKPIVINEDTPFAIKNVALIKFANSHYNNLFIKELLNSEYFCYIAKKNNRGGTQKFISLSDIRNILIPCIPIELQNKFATFVIQAEKCLFESYKLYNSLSFGLNYFNML